MVRFDKIKFVKKKMNFLISNFFNKNYLNKKVIVTGHTGFKGSWLSIWLYLLGAKVYGISDRVLTDPSHFDLINNEFVEDIRIDIRSQNDVVEVINDIKPDFIFHLAAQSLVNKSYDFPKLTWETNVIGTINILESLRKLEKKCISIFITSDKCYENVEWVWGYKETDRLGGKDPYSSSKAATELAIYSYTNSFFAVNSNVSIASARAGNVIGGGDWSLNRLIPDCVRAWSNNEKVFLRNPYSTRPWQHVLEPLGGYLLLGYKLANDYALHGQSFNFGPHLDKNYSVIDVVNQFSKTWDIAKYEIEKDIDKEKYESNLLKLNCDKALFYLNWKSSLNFEDTISLTANWYRNFYEKIELPLELTKKQIFLYSEIMQNSLNY